MIQPVLFVGGCGDGRIVNIDTQVECYSLAVTKKLNTQVQSDSSNVEELRYENHDYIMEFLTKRGHEFMVMRYIGISLKEVIDKLNTRY